MREEVTKLKEARAIKELFYPKWLVNTVVVKKKSGKWQVCVDFTDLNKACPKDPFSMPKIDQLVDATVGHPRMSFLDAFQGYPQIPLTLGDQEKTAFVTPIRNYHYKVMPFGLKNAGSIYQRTMTRKFESQLGKNIEIYIDDMVVKSKVVSDHLGDLGNIFEVLIKYKLRLNASKCSFQVLTEECVVAFQQLKDYLARPLIMSNPEPDEVLFAYIIVASYAVSLVLIRVDCGVQRSVYYLSKSLHEAEVRYLQLEKAILTVVLGTRKLPHYF